MSSNQQPTSNYQPTLFDPILPTVTPGGARGLSLAEQFNLFHQANPHVYNSLRTRALFLKRKDVKTSIKALFEILRWEHATTTNDASSEFKLNNNYTSFYARLLMENEPELAGFFETRQMRWQIHSIN